MKKIRIGKLNKKNLVIGGFILAILIVAIIIGVVLIGGQKKDEGQINEPNNNEVEQPKNLKIVDANSKSRPFAVMINNISTARPLQSGLQDAYIIYEMIVEGGITRYMALFLDQDTERIGSIRSSRHYYLDYALENDAIYVHHGQSPQAQSDFGKLGIDRVQVNNTTTGWRDNTLNVASEHTLFTSIEKLNNGVGNLRTTREKGLLLNYSVDSIDLAAINGSKKADKVSIKYSSGTTSSYEYDSENKVYNRFVNGKDHTDYVTKKQYTFKNIITYQVANDTIVGDGKGRQELDNIGSGTGYYISEGYAVPITWEKTSRSAQTVYKLENGEKLKVNDGNTFIQIQPKGEALNIS